VYGDTDSIMVNSDTHDVEKAEAMAMQLKKEVNKVRVVRRAVLCVCVCVCGDVTACVRVVYIYIYIYI